MVLERPALVVLGAQPPLRVADCGAPITPSLGIEAVIDGQGDREIAELPDTVDALALYAPSSPAAGCTAFPRVRWIPREVWRSIVLALSVSAIAAPGDRRVHVLITCTSGDADRIAAVCSEIAGAAARGAHANVRIIRVQWVVCNNFFFFFFFLRNGFASTISGFFVLIFFDFFFVCDQFIDPSGVRTVSASTVTRDTARALASIDEDVCTWTISGTCAVPRANREYTGVPAALWPLAQRSALVASTVAGHGTRATAPAAEGEHDRLVTALLGSDDDDFRSTPTTSTSTTTSNRWHRFRPRSQYRHAAAATWPARPAQRVSAPALRLLRAHYLSARRLSVLAGNGPTAGAPRGSAGGTSGPAADASSSHRGVLTDLAAESSAVRTHCHTSLLPDLVAIAAAVAAAGGPCAAEAGAHHAAAAVALALASAAAACGAGARCAEAAPHGIPPLGAPGRTDRAWCVPSGLAREVLRIERDLGV
jgi:hypothetical protein